MRSLGDLMKDGEAMKRFGQTMVLWDFHARQPRTVLSVPGVPLEIRWA
jgi:selenium-binding protein 1